MAEEQGLDVAEVSGNVVPPVCRILDYGRYRYEQTKKEHETRKAHKVGTVRDVHLRPKIGKNDLDLKIRMVKRFLDEGDKVKVSVIFRGREITHPEIGWRLMQQVMQELKTIANAEKPAAMEGRNMNVVLVRTGELSERNTEPKLVKESTDAKT